MLTLTQAKRQAARPTLSGAYEIRIVHYENVASNDPKLTFAAVLVARRGLISAHPSVRTPLGHT